MKPLDPKSLKGAKQALDSVSLNKLSRKTMVIGGISLLVASGLGWWLLGGSHKPMPQPRKIAVAVGKAAIKDMDYRIEAPGSVQPMVSVPIRPRVDSMVEKVQFQDGSSVKEGDLLFKLDSRAIDAMIDQAAAVLKRDQASLVKAQRDVERFSGLVSKGTTAKVTLDDAETNADMLTATVKQDQANLDNLRTQRTYYDIHAPVTGRIGISSVRPGNVVRADSTSAPLATVNQLSPIYITFGVPERYIPDLRAAGVNASVQATLQNGTIVEGGHVAFIENSVDPQTGTILVRATFDNKDEKLWPGTLATVRVSLRVDKNMVTVPTEALQNGQRGDFVFVVEDGKAKVREVAVQRSMDGESIITRGLQGDETVVTDGQLSLRDNAPIDIKRGVGTAQ
ncbi:MAG TPA: efflux RND transporter periplasmic adaptor subunit [Xanthobacteraceae bacterium]|jgi:RND family efflux transporter MFP subunit|nr:efflux RND transporter periplasmic adaptor subunit [Xanthobacteraceae bacterium]